MECSWLRSGKAKTLNYDKEDFNRIFKKKEDGGGFNRAGTYGTNALYTWRTQLLPQAAAGGREGGREGGHVAAQAHQAQEEEEEEGGREGGGVEGTMRFYLTYRPVVNESEAILEGSDVVLVNFGLHYLVDKAAEFQEEMVALLGKLRGFGMTEGKQLIWREVRVVCFSSLFSSPSLPRPSLPPPEQKRNIKQLMYTSHHYTHRRQPNIISTKAANSPSPSRPSVSESLAETTKPQWTNASPFTSALTSTLNGGINCSWAWRGRKGGR
jgi:hypothetical protein